MIPAYGETVTLRRTATSGVDEYGNDVIVSEQTVVRNVAVWPRTSSGTTGGGETLGDRDTVIVGLTLLVPPGVLVTATDQVDVRGKTYDVDGEPGVWRSYLTGYRAGTEVALRRVEG